MSSDAPAHPALERTIAILGALIAFPTVSRDGNRACIDWIAERLAARGARISISSEAPGKANLFASLGPDRPGGVILSGHTDVVPVEGQAWSSDPFALRREGGRLYGRGTADMKGFVACAIALAESLEPDTLARPLHLAFTYDEEVGCMGARVLIRQMQAEGLRPAAAIIGEPTGLEIVDAHKGCCQYTLVFHGREGHSSRPDQAVNALEAAVRTAHRLTALAGELRERAPEGSRFTPPWSTLQVTGLHAGTAHNVIPHRAELMWEMRPVREEDRLFVREALARHLAAETAAPAGPGLPPLRVEEVFATEVPALEPRPDNPAVELLRAVTGANGPAGAVAYATEAGLFQGAGVPAAVCGPGDIAQAHRPDEFVTEAQLSACLAMLDRLAAHLRAHGG